MLTSLAIVFLLGMLAAHLSGRFKLPGLLGMILAGAAVGPHGFDLLDESILHIAPDLRQLALIIILVRVGLSLDLKDLRQVGRPAFLMCWLPATLEIAGVMLLAPRLLGVSLLDAAIIGTVIAAVSPAVIVPRMLFLLESGYGRKKAVPQLLMAGASMDDIYVIVIFAALTGVAQGAGFSAAQVLRVPLGVLFGIGGGIGAGLALACWFKRCAVRDSARILVLLSVAFLLVAAEKRGVIPFSGLPAVICTGLTVLKFTPETARQLAGKLSRLWVGAEVLLFVLVGATVDVRYAAEAGGWILAVVAGALAFRMAGVWCSLWKTRLAFPERLFCMLAYTPKATVQAAIGAIPLGLGLPCGPTVLAVAVLSILLTAPAGALTIDLTCKKLLAGDYLPDSP